MWELLYSTHPPGKGDGEEGEQRYPRSLATVMCEYDALGSSKVESPYVTPGSPMYELYKLGGSRDIT